MNNDDVVTQHTHCDIDCIYRAFDRLGPGVFNETFLARQDPSTIQAAEALRINEAARLKGLKISCLVRDGITMVMTLPAGWLAGARSAGRRNSGTDTIKIDTLEN